MPHRRRPALIALLLTTAAVAAALSAPSSAQDLDRLREQRDSKAGSEQGLEADVARLGRLIDRLQADIAVVERRRQEVRQELAEDQAQLASLRDRLREERVRAQRLRERLDETQRVLSTRLVGLYKAGGPDVLSVVLSSDDFSDLMDRAAFIERINSQDRRIIVNVRRARTDAKAAVTRLAKAEQRQEETTEAIAARSEALAGIDAALTDRRAAFAEARQERSVALKDTRTDRARLERRITQLEARRARSTGATSGGPWAIPWPIVQCESGGTNTPPNHAGASGYYQIIPATWKGFGGSGPHAYLASKAEQDRIAAKIWDGGRGAHNWVCASLVD